MPRYTRNSVLRARGERPSEVISLRSRARRLATRLETTEATMDSACHIAARSLRAVSEIVRTTQPVIDRAADRGTEASGTIRRINRIASEALPL